MSWFDQISIRTKLLTVVMIIIVPILIGQTLYTISKEFAFLEGEMKQQISVIAKLTGEYCVTDLLFQDSEAASRSLSILAGTPSIVQATVYDRFDRVFAAYTCDDTQVPMLSIPDGQSFTRLEDGYLQLKDVIDHDGETIGSIYIISSTKSLLQSVRTQAQNSIFIMLILIVVTVIITAQLQHVISAPILRLAELAQRVAKTGNYELRGEETRNDEVGMLVKGFNQMLDEIQSTTVSKNYIDNIIASMLESLFVIAKDGSIIKVNNSTIRQLGYSGRELENMNISDLIENPEILDRHGQFIETSLRHKSGQAIPVSFSSSALDSNAMVCVAHDLTSQKEYEHEIKESLKEKEIMIKEIHHRVKNNLQVISSLLNLQSDYIDNPEIKELFGKSQSRIGSMALIHSKLYQSKDLAQIDIEDYIRTLATEILYTYEVKHDIRLNIKANVDQLNLDAIVPIGLMLNEFITNSLKYAFDPGEAGEIFIYLNTLEYGYIEMVVGDNGKGIPKDFVWRNLPSLGMQLIQMLTAQLDGEIELDSTFSGTKFTLTFRKPEE